MKFTFEQNVQLVLSGQQGVVIGHATYLAHGPQYLVRHKDADGDQVERWYDENAIQAAT